MNEGVREGPFNRVTSHPGVISESESLKPETRTLVRCVARGLRPLKGDCGSGLVEYAIVFLLFITMILGVIDFGRALYTYHFLSNVTRDATRWAAVNGHDCINDNSCDGAGYMNNGAVSPSDVQTYVTNHTPPGIDTSKITTTVTWPVNADSPATCAGTAGPPAVPAVPNAPGCTVEVQVSYVFSFLFAYVHKSTVTMSSTSEMLIAH
jgi:Flp pilus assembly protein TadG